MRQSYSHSQLSPYFSLSHFPQLSVISNQSITLLVEMADLKASVLVSHGPLYKGRDGRLDGMCVTALPALSCKTSLIDGTTLSQSVLPVASESLLFS